MKERKQDEVISTNKSKLIFLALGLYSLAAIILAFLWSGESSSLLFILAAAAIFIYSLFDPKIGFFALLVFRTTFDSAGGQELLNIFGISINFTFIDYLSITDISQHKK